MNKKCYNCNGEIPSGKWINGCFVCDACLEYCDINFRAIKKEATA